MGKKPLSVLIVEPAPDVCQTMSAFCEGEGHECTCAGSAEEALKIAEAGGLDLIMLSGTGAGPADSDLVKRVREAGTDAPIIITATEVDAETVKRALDQGADDFFQRPAASPAEIDADSLRLRIRCVLKAAHTRRLTVTDWLTELYNRRFFETRLAEEIHRQKRYHGGPVSLVMADIDGFKRVNDRFGHPVGDQVLRRIATLFRRESRTIDVVSIEGRLSPKRGAAGAEEAVCRAGGDEFSIILPETPRAGAALYAKRVCTAIASERFELGRESVHVTISAGVATFPRDADNAEGLLAQADRALYVAKSEGGNCMVCYEATMHGADAGGAPPVQAPGNTDRGLPMV